MEPTSASTVMCVPTTPADQCRPCIDEDQARCSMRVVCMPLLNAPLHLAQDQSYCVPNGYKQEVHCSVSGGALSNASSDGYVTFQSCPVMPGDFMSVVRFEVCIIAASRMLNTMHMPRVSVVCLSHAAVWHGCPVCDLILIHDETETKVAGCTIL